MAGSIGANSFPRFSSIKLHPTVACPPSPFPTSLRTLPTRRSRINMAANGAAENGSPGVEEPSLKVPKLSENGAAVDHHHLPLLKVKKLSQNAVLPSRASPLSAGYDLSRFKTRPSFGLFQSWEPSLRSPILLISCPFLSAAESKVPARGKALIPTDLSIAIPEGTYARIGNPFFSKSLCFYL